MSQMPSEFSNKSFNDISLEQFEGFLQSKLRRGTIPTIQQLGDYHFGLLSEEEVQVVELFLEDFPHRRAELTMLQSYLSELESELPSVSATQEERSPSVLQQVGSELERIRSKIGTEIDTINKGIHIVFAKRIPDTPISIGIRNQGQEEKPRIYEAGDLHISLDVLNDSERPDRRSLLGLVIGPEVEGYEAYLWRTEPAEKVKSVEVTDAGNFVVPGLEPDRYDLILDGPGMVVVEGLDVGV